MLYDINRRKQGDLGVAAAITWFTMNGYVVCLPFTEGQSFDMIVVNGNATPQRVQVKTTGFSKNGNFIVQLRTSGGAGNASTVKTLAKEVDLLFVLTETGEQYLIPRPEITTSSGLVLTKDRQQKFRVVSELGWNPNG